MQKIIFFIIVSLFYSINVNAQTNAFGAKASFFNTEMDGNIAYMGGLGVGASYMVHLGKYFKVSADASIFSRGNFCLSVSPMASYPLSASVSVLGGVSPYFSQVLSSSKKELSYFDFKDSDIGFIPHIGVLYNRSNGHYITLNIGYQLGMQNLYPSYTPNTLYTKGYVATLGYYFGK